MSKNVEKININFLDQQRLNFKDSTRPNETLKKMLEQHSKSSIKGLVQIHETKDNGEKELIVENNNLIVYPGRVGMLCRAFGQSLGTSSVNYKFAEDLFVAYFAVGTGGASSANNQNPLVVNSTDYALTTHGSLTGSTKRIVVNGRDYVGFDDDYPRFIPEPEIINNSDILDAMRVDAIDTGTGVYQRDTYLIANIQVTLDAATANGTTGTQEISEAGLFLAPSSNVSDSTWRTGTYNSSTGTGQYTSRHLEMFARVTFPTVTKNSSREITLSWYIFF